MNEKKELLPSVNGERNVESVEIEVGDINGVNSSKGLTVLTATVFLVGEMAGSGILALPQALDMSTYIGAILMMFCALLCAYTGNLLGKCWNMIQSRYPEFRGHVRYPYPAIGLITFGKPAKHIVSVSIIFTMFGGAVVFLIISAQNVQGLLQNIFHAYMPCCYLQLIIAGCLLPLTWLGTPKDFWPIALGAAAATSVACIVILTAMGLDSKEDHKEIVHTNPDVLQFFAAAGIMLYAFGGHPAFPTFQNDMKVPANFGKAVLFAYIVLLLMYLPVAVAGYFVYGKDVKSNILQSISPGPMLYVVQVLITCHLFCGFVIVINPVTQELEDALKVSRSFTWKRILTRSLVLALILCISETIPKFGAILSLVGGSSMVILACICPPLFYFKLTRMEGDWPKVTIPLHIKVILVQIVLVGSIIGVFSTYSSIKTMVSPHTFSVPCFISKTAGDSS